MKDEEKKSKDLDLSKVLATALAYTKKTLKCFIFQQIPRVDTVIYVIYT